MKNSIIKTFKNLSVDLKWFYRSTKSRVFWKEIGNTLFVHIDRNATIQNIIDKANRSRFDSIDIKKINEMLSKPDRQKKLIELAKAYWTEVVYISQNQESQTLQINRNQTLANIMKELDNKSGLDRLRFWWLVHHNLHNSDLHVAEFAKSIWVEVSYHQ